MFSRNFQQFLLKFLPEFLREFIHVANFNQIVQNLRHFSRHYPNKLFRKYTNFGKVLQHFHRQRNWWINQFHWLFLQILQLFTLKIILRISLAISLGIPTGISIGKLMFFHDFFQDFLREFILEFLREVLDEFIVNCWRNYFVTTSEEIRKRTSRRTTDRHSDRILGGTSGRFRWAVPRRLS